MSYREPIATPAGVSVSGGSGEPQGGTAVVGVERVDVERVEVDRVEAEPVGGNDL
jgi:hypothetical protein